MKIKINKQLILENLKEVALNAAKNGNTQIGDLLYNHVKLNQGLDAETNKNVAEKKQFDNDINSRDSEERLKEKARRMNLAAKGIS